MTVFSFFPAMLAEQLPWLGRHSALEPVGTASAHVTSLWWWMFWTASAIYIIVMGALLYAAFRRQVADASATQGESRTVTRIVALAIGATIVVLFIFVGLDFFTARANTLPEHAPIKINIVARQWWWEAIYPDDSVAQRQVSTANEIHVPVGQAVLFTLTSRDVIHSFWVPNLNGKTDIVPGYKSYAWFRADTAGVYRGQCAEFCGMQHAKMAFTIVAEPMEQYKAWYAAQLAPATPPTDSLRAQGERIFMAGACSSCHSIRGTDASATLGPELTHIASQMTLASGTLQNTPQNLARWITNAQQVKPGTTMPSQVLSPRDLKVLVAYLEGLR